MLEKENSVNFLQGEKHLPHEKPSLLPPMGPALWGGSQRADQPARPAAAGVTAFPGSPPHTPEPHGHDSQFKTAFYELTGYSLLYHCENDPMCSGFYPFLDAVSVSFDCFELPFPFCSCFLCFYCGLNLRIRTSSAL